MKKTRKVLAVVLAFVLTVSLSVAGTIAYLADTDSAKNTFTTGNVKIDLTEAEVKPDDKGNLIEDTSKARFDLNDVQDDIEDINSYGKIYPGQTIFKDPTIELLAGSENAYLGAVVTVNVGKDANKNGIDVEDILGCNYLDMLDVSKILSGGFAVPGEKMKTTHKLHGKNGLPVYGDTEYSVYQVPNKAEGEYKFYFFIEGEKTAGTKVVLFDTITIPATWGNEQMAKLANLEITVDAYAVQAHGFKDCYEAMTTAFGTVFSF
ncbi:MAG: SipW-dependent-type signal peptide-containing protein [Oscillospiraceae bacterium]|nr:SipW-dependent-type signal peptide-containing protein [Oscillospiraceae bacterium]